MKTNPSIDWKPFIGKLAAIAAGWMVDRSVDKEDLMINGVGPKDLAQTAALEVFEKYHQIENGKTEGDLFRLAYAAMWHDFLDLIKSAAYKKNKRIEEISDGQSGQDLAVEDSKLRDVEEESAAKYYRSLANGEQNLLDFIDAVLELEVYKREDAAALLGITPQEVTNLSRKLRDRHTSRQRKAAKLEVLKK